MNSIITMKNTANNAQFISRWLKFYFPDFNL